MIDTAQACHAKTTSKTTAKTTAKPAKETSAVKSETEDDGGKPAVAVA